MGKPGTASAENIVGQQLKMTVSIVVPAWNEERTLASTLAALHQMNDERGELVWSELIVVDDGSTDNTSEEALLWATSVIVHGRRLGKGAAMRTGWTRAKGDIVLFADADLGHSAVHLDGLLAPVKSGEADMAIARFTAPPGQGGFGLVKTFAARGIYRLTGLKLEAPLSGQRAVSSSLLRQLGRPPAGFGIEVGLTIDAARLGCRIVEVPLPLVHRETGRSFAGFWHRGMQLLHIGKTMLTRWMRLVPK